jgi:hypothetical protein
MATIIGDAPAPANRSTRVLALLLDEHGRASARRAPRLGGWRDDQIGAALGGSAYLAQNGIRSEQARLSYVDKAHRLDPFDNAGRERLKILDRDATPAPEREIIKAFRRETGAREGSVGQANRTNPKVTEQARALGRLGRASLAGSVLLGTGEVIASDDRPRASASVAGAMGGGWAGGVAGAEAGAAIGSLAPPYGLPVGAAIGGFLGAIGGGVAGHEAGGRAVDHARRPRSQ